MTQSELTSILLANASRLKAMGATGLYLFGSRARGDNQPGSDIDLFIDCVESRKRPRLLDLIAFEHDISQQTGLQTQLALRQSLYPKIRIQAERDAVKVF